MPITSTSTYADVLAQYNDNLDWDGDSAKASLALAAVRWLLINRPAKMIISDKETNFTALEEEKKRLEEYVSACGPAAKKAVTFTRGQMRL